MNSWSLNTDLVQREKVTDFHKTPYKWYATRDHWKKYFQFPKISNDKMAELLESGLGGIVPSFILGFIVFAQQPLLDHGLLIHEVF